uniref:Uncharacterized protein n=1 Tax=Mesocestoides corti TaxID=53468 RepID=A0A5K3FNU0_MESCO
MEDELIYDTSLLNHATLTTLVQKSPLWRGPFCFEEMLTTLRLFYTYLTPLKMCRSLHLSASLIFFR